MTSIESDVCVLLESRSEAMFAKDIDRLMALYSHDIVYFDLVPPLRYAGVGALRGRFLDWFDRWESPIGQDISDVTVFGGGGVAVAHMLIWASGILSGQREVGYWVRTTNGCRMSSGRWLITHEHVSLPVDMASGRAVMDLMP